MTGYDPTTLGDRLREISENDDLPSESGARWPGAPEPRTDDEGRVVNAVETCPSCGEPSTLSFRCSECGYDLTDSGGSGRDA